MKRYYVLYKCKCGGDIIHGGVGEQPYCKKCRTIQNLPLPNGLWFNINCNNDSRETRTIHATCINSEQDIKIVREGYVKVLIKKDLTPEETLLLIKIGLEEFLGYGVER